MESLQTFDRQQVMLKLAEIVDKNYDELALLDSLDMGGPLSRTLLGRRRAVALLRYYAGLVTTIEGQTIPNSVAGDVFAYTQKEPVGVVGAINPWNGPIGLAIWKICPVLASGYSFSNLQSASFSIEARVCMVGSPGVVNGHWFRRCGAALASRRRQDRIHWRTEVGRVVGASAGNMKRLSMELGGKSPVVFDDADLDAAVPGAAMAVFQNWDNL
jgi:aldehyde dehydrogenase (NAD+)